MSLLKNTYKDIYNRRFQSYLINEWEDKNLPFIYNSENLVETIITFFKTESSLIYPAKSYFVAIVYAYCMNKWFNIDIYEALNFDDLLPDDMCFVPYYKDTETYSKVIDNIGEIWYYSSIQKTVDFFKREYLIDATND